MPVVYAYDGTFAGFLSCVFESYSRKETPFDILPPDACQAVLYPCREVPTDQEKAGRVLRAVPARISPEALDITEHGFLTCAPQKELLLLRFLRLGFAKGGTVCSMLTEPTVAALLKAVRHLNHESHLLTGFVRFSDYEGALVAQIEPKNSVLPLLMPHFCDRYRGQAFLIYDRTHGEALAFDGAHARIGPVAGLTLPEAGEEELAYRKLWKLFYDTIAIQERENPRCRMSHMPKRFWRYMTELNGGEREGTGSLVSPLVPPAPFAGGVLSAIEGADAENGVGG